MGKNERKKKRQKEKQKKASNNSLFICLYKDSKKYTFQQLREVNITQAMMASIKQKLASQAYPSEMIILHYYYQHNTFFCAEDTQLHWHTFQKCFYLRTEHISSMRKSLTDDDVNFTGGNKRLESSPMERDLGILNDSELNMSQQWTLAAKRAYHTLGCTRLNAASQVRERIVCFGEVFPQIVRVVLGTTLYLCPYKDKAIKQASKGRLQRWRRA